MTRDELKEKVARAIGDTLDFDGDPLCAHLAHSELLDAAEAALSAIEAASMAIVPVGVTVGMLDAMCRASEMNQTVPGEDVSEAAIRAGRVK